MGKGGDGDPPVSRYRWLSEAAAGSSWFGTPSKVQLGG